VAVLGAGFAFPGVALAQRITGPGLSPDLPYANDVERQAAAANQAAFVALDPICNPGGMFDQTPSPDFQDLDPADPAGGVCTETAFFVYVTARELVHTANELQNAGPTIASLRVDQQGLGTALRWTAAEELAAQGSMATEFANSQLANLSARLNALRFGARGFTVAGFYEPTQNDSELVARNRSGVRGGGASADEDQRETYSSWGGFINGSFGYGNKVDTDLENAFDFDGSELTLGLDYRFQSNFVLGAIFGYSEQTIDFDEAASDIRVVDGGMESEGRSGILFGLFHGESLAASASLGVQTFDYDVTRAIKYPSLNPNVESANSIARSSPDADIVTGTFNVGYSFRAGRFTLEPYLGADYLDIEIDAFSEDHSVESLSGTQDDDAFHLLVAEQSFKSLDATAGLRLQFTSTPQFGVIVPFVAIEAHKELENDSRIIRAGYAGLADANIPGLSELFTFEVPTDEIDDSYYTWSVGVSMVLRGGRQRKYDGPITGGLMTFVQYKSLESLDNYEEQVITAGFRYEF
jgi:uncharacterized protein with beta-barrel porin domain